MEDKKVLRIHRVGVLCMVYYAYPNDIVCGNRDISGDAWLINWSTYMYTPYADSKPWHPGVLVKIFSPRLALGILMKRVPNATSGCRCGEILRLNSLSRTTHDNAPVKYAIIGWHGGFSPD